jgi:S-adenosylmethionine decarboxylase
LHECIDFILTEFVTLGMDKKIRMGLGPHLTLDLYGCNREKLHDFSFIYKILDELPSKIGMHKISAPSVSFFSGNPLGKSDSFDQGGISGFVLIAESHITIHTFVVQEFASVDIFSCKKFDVKKAEEYIVRALEAKKIEKNLFDRGKEFPKDVKLAEPIVLDERMEIRNKLN